MLFNSYKNQTKNNLLLSKYLSLTDSGVNPSEILVLLGNSTLKKKFTSEVLDKIKNNSIEQLNIHSFFSLVYNTLNDNWCFIENLISSGKTFILPNLVGLEVSQLILKDIIKDVDVKGYNSKKSLLHQIFRRYSLIVQNKLTDEQVKERSKILKEPFGEDAEIIIKKLMRSTLEKRSFDYLRQTLIFNHIYRNTDYFKNIKYLLMEDADEITPACFEFIKFLKPQLKDWLICYDSLGSSRCGYLSADTSIENKLKKLFNETPVGENESFVQGDIIFENVINNAQKPLMNFSLTSLSKRAEILDFAINKIEVLFKKGIKPYEISIITPVQDNMLKFTLQENLKTCDLLFLSGSEKLVDNPFVRASLNILKLMLDIEITEIDLRVILSDYAGIPLKYTNPILTKFKENKKLPEIELEFYNERYQNFLKTFKEVKEKKSALSSKIYEIFSRVVKFIPENKINNFTFFIKELEDFEKVFGENSTYGEKTQDIITQFENSIIAENPINTLEIGENN